MACPRYGGAVVKMECVNAADIATEYNDTIAYSTLSNTNPNYYQTNWYGIDHSPFLPGVVLSITYTHPRLGTNETISGNMYQTTFKSNSYIANYASSGAGIVDVQGVPRVFFISETFTNNGDSSTNAITQFVSSVITAPTTLLMGDYSIDTATTTSIPNTQLMTSVIKVILSSYVSIKGLHFTNNWLMESNNVYSNFRAQLMYMN